MVEIARAQLSVLPTILAVPSSLSLSLFVPSHLNVSSGATSSLALPVAGWKRTVTDLEEM